MDKPGLINKLNEAIALELGALIQYNQYSHVLLGTDRRIWSEFFQEQSNEALDHARRFADRVVALGGTPSCEPDPVQQTNDVTEMLRNALEVERRAVKVYTEALSYCEDHAGYRNVLEDQVDEETQDVEELEKYLNDIEKVKIRVKDADATMTLYALNVERSDPWVYGKEEYKNSDGAIKEQDVETPQGDFTLTTIDSIPAPLDDAELTYE